MSRIISLYPVRIPRITYFNTNSFLVSTLVRFEYFSILRIYEYILIRVIRVICVRLKNQGLLVSADAVVSKSLVIACSCGLRLSTIMAI